MQMTEAKVLEALFRTPAHPHWGGDPAHLSVGLELEYVIHRKGNPDALMRKEGFTAFLREMEAYGYGPHPGAPESHYRMSKDTPPGFVVIKPDFAFHILEIALPVRSCPGELRALIDGLLIEVDSALEYLGYERFTRGVCEGAAYCDFDLVNLKGHAELVAALKSNTAHEVWDSCFPAYISSTQVHLNVLEPLTFTQLARWYELEWIFSLSFSDAMAWRGRLLNDARPLFYNNTFGEGFPLAGVPAEIPTSAAHYAEMVNQTLGVFPQNADFPVREYSSIRPRMFGSVEFRSASTQENTDRILELVAFRILQCLYGYEYADTPIREGNWQRELIYAICEGRTLSADQKQLRDASLSRLIGVVPHVPARWREILEMSPVFRDLREEMPWAEAASWNLKTAADVFRHRLASH